MFLNRLSEEEKVAFLELAHYMAISDGEKSEFEKDIIEKYCLEMQIENVIFDKKVFDISSVLQKIQCKKNQKIVLLEIMALVYADSILDQEEQNILNTIIENFGLTQQLSIIYGEWTKAILALYTQGEALIEINV